MSIEKILKEIADQYQSLPNRFIPNNQNSTYYAFSNQTKMKALYDELLANRSMKLPGRENLAVLVGESFFSSLLSALVKHVDAVLFVDIDSRVIVHNMFIVECLRKAETKREFLRLYCEDNPIVKMKILIQRLRFASSASSKDFISIGGPSAVLDLEMLNELFLSTKNYLEGIHFLESADAYQKAREATLKLKFYTLTIDLYQVELMTLLGKQLNLAGVHIPIINVSNVYDYDSKTTLSVENKEHWFTSGRLYKSLDFLLDRPEDTLVVYSIMDPDKNYEILVTRFCLGLSSYKSEVNSYSTAINASRAARSYATARIEQLKKDDQQLQMFMTKLEKLNRGSTEFKSIYKSAMELTEKMKVNPDLDLAKLHRVLYKPLPSYFFTTVADQTMRNNRLYNYDYELPDEIHRLMVPINDRLTTFINEYFKNTVCFYRRTWSAYCLVDMVFISKDDEAIKLMGTFEKYNLPYVCRVVANVSWISLIDPNRYVNKIDEMINEYEVVNDITLVLKP